MSYGPHSEEQSHHKSGLSYSPPSLRKSVKKSSDYIQNSAQKIAFSVTRRDVYANPRPPEGYQIQFATTGMGKPEFKSPSSHGEIYRTDSLLPKTLRLPPFPFTGLLLIFFGNN